MCGTIARQQRKTPKRFTCNTACHSSGVHSHIFFVTPAIPALLTRMSILPNSLIVCWKAASTDSALLISTWTLNDDNPFGASGFRSHKQQRAPESVNRRAMASPIPRAPPVTIATRSCKSILFMGAALLEMRRAFVQPPAYHGRIRAEPRCAILGSRRQRSGLSEEIQRATVLQGQGRCI